MTDYNTKGTGNLEVYSTAARDPPQQSVAGDLQVNATKDTPSHTIPDKYTKQQHKVAVYWLAEKCHQHVRGGGM